MAITNFTWEYIFKKFQDRGYVLCTPTYKNAHQRLRYYCLKHPQHLQEIIYNSLQRGCGCRFCGVETRSKNRSLTLTKVKEVVASKGYKFLSIDSLNSKGYVRYVCHKHPTEVQKAKYNNIQQGFGCPSCYQDKPKKFIFTKRKTVLLTYLRGYIKFWLDETRLVARGVCELSGDSSTAIHHQHKPFYKIVDESLLELGLDRRPLSVDYTPDELQQLVDKVVSKHSLDQLGVCLSQKLHAKYHSMYGYGEGINEENLQEFIKLYREGKLLETYSDPEWEGMEF